MSEDNPVMRMYEAQAIAIEKQLEIDRLNREREELIESFKVLGRIDRGNPGQSTSKNDEKQEIEQLKQRDKEKEAEIQELKTKNEELTERMRLFELEMERKADKSHSKNNDDGEKLGILENGEIIFLFANMQDQIRQINGHITRLQIESKLQNAKNTILILGYSEENHYALVLSADRTKWITTQLELPHKAEGSGAVYFNEEIYLCGGWNNLKGLHKLDRNSLKWIKLADMNIGRSWITNSCLEWNGYIWVFGGSNEKFEPLKCVEKYDPKEDKWILMPEMKYGRHSAAAVIWNNSIIITGGFSNGGRINRIECFKDGHWTELPNLPNSLSDHSLISYKNKLVLIGGSDRKARNEVYEINPQELTCQLFPERSNTKWSRLPPLKHPSYLHAGIVLDGEIYVIGGDGTTKLDSVEIFDGQKWRDGPPLPYRMAGIPAVIIPQTLADRVCNYKP